MVMRVIDAATFTDALVVVCGLDMVDRVVDSLVVVCDLDMVDRVVDLLVVVCDVTQFFSVVNILTVLLRSPGPGLQELSCSR